MKLEDEHTPPCYICGKIWQRKDAHNWLFFCNILVCKDHPGACEWYTGALKMMEERLRLAKIALEKVDRT